MSVSDLTQAYLWFVLVTSSALIVRIKLADPNLRKAWRDLRSVNKKWKAKERNFTHIEACLERLLKSGSNGAFVIVGHRESARFIQFRKLIYEAGDYGIELGFPNVDWSKDFFPEVEAHCQAHGIPYRVKMETHCGTGESLYVDFLHVDCGQDLVMAYDLTRAIWTGIFGLAEDAPHRIETHGISPYGELLDRPKQQPMSFNESMRRQNQRPGARLPITWQATAIMVLWLFLRPIAFIGLLATLLRVTNSPPDWVLRLGGIEFSGTTGSLLFFGLYLACLVGRIYWGQPREIARPWLETKALVVWGWIVRVTVPICALVIWSGA